MLLFYIRLFPQQWMQWVRWSLFGLTAWTVAWGIGTIFAFIFQCRPIEYLWRLDLQDGKCVKQNALYFVCGLTSTLTILTVLLFPLPITFKLQASKAKKWGLAFSLTAGAL